MGPRSLSRSELLVGARFGQHEIVRLLGHGATSSVFEAKQVLLGRRVALKVLHDHLAADAKARARFVREGRVAAQLRHPNVVEVLDVGSEGATPYLVMELLEGEDLRATLVRRGKLPVEEALALLLPIASALGFAHDRGAIHRDLKPGNVFLARDARGERVPKLVDFGLSKMAGIDEGAALTTASAVDGTVVYMPPEQAQGTNRATARSDQYALAVVLYQAVTGALPYAVQSVLELVDAVRAAKPAPPSALDARIPRAFDEVVLRALESDPGARFPTVRAFARALLPLADAATGAQWSREMVPASGPVPTAGSLEAAPASTRSPSRPPTPALAPTPESTPTRPSRRDPVRSAPLPCAPGASPFHIKGLAYRGLVRAVGAMPGGLDALCDALDDARLRDFLRQPFLASGWYDLLPIQPITMTIAAIVGVQFQAMVRTGTISQVRYDAIKVFHRMFDGATVEDIPSRVPRFNAQYLDFGRTVATQPEPKLIVVRFEGAPAYSAAWQGAMMSAYSEETARLAGGQGVEMRMLPPEPAGMHARFPVLTLVSELRWK
jgi:serine/threonine-protein kinase